MLCTAARSALVLPWLALLALLLDAEQAGCCELCARSRR
jgi:hypothetical protein